MAFHFLSKKQIAALRLTARPALKSITSLFMACGTCIALGMGATVTAQAAEQRPLELGIVPNLTARVLLVQYQPVREYLERELNRPVRVSSAASWNEFDQRTKKNEYDIIVTSANWARLAQVDRGYQLVGAWIPNLKGFIVHEKKNPLTNIADLRGKTLATSNAMSIVALRGMKWLNEQGLVRDKDFKTVSAANDESVGHLILRGEAIAALASNGEFKNIPENVRNQLDIFAQVADVSAFIVLTNPKLEKSDAQEVRTAFSKFLAGTEDGKKFTSLTGITGMLAPKDIDVQALDAYLDETRRLSAAADR
jgi:phosphonate transport system substrate-binding protein